ncbi:hypothetical protein [Methanobrevibacter olleyae]|uniref:Adhesin-like protein n=1 Tax=Methanobrevibacter olleyae TaxID=294671 RepID=A0A126QZA8_METOL|nr:hypothetical protein [Methanobrevibacter olleyae]AMK15127.1 hypothetical protein YLM1_0570 [Methanobrevibacter olleyae]SFL51465.1 hypothetical protein SAMN02910297_01104 [Methanobrevibacter olleyae]
MDNEDKKSKKKSKKPSKNLLYFLIILIVILAEGFILCYDYATSEDSLLQYISDDYPILNNVLKYIPTDLTNSNSTDLSTSQKPIKTIGKNSIGTVTLEGPYGNNKSSVKIAYILGQHPRESNAHDAIYKSLLNSSDYLNYSYYVYRINVSAESEDFEESRMNGQLLAQNFVVNDVVKNNYNLAIDIHSSNGGYVQDPYIFAPISTDLVAYDSANNITKTLKNIIYYEPASYSSPQYSTIPIDEGGVPAIVFEMRGNPDYSLETGANQFIHAVDKLIL